MEKTLNIVLIISLSISPFVNDLSAQNYESKNKKKTDNKKKDLTKYRRYSITLGTIMCVAGGLMYWKLIPTVTNDNPSEAPSQQTTLLQKSKSINALRSVQQTSCTLSSLQISTLHKRSNPQLCRGEQQTSPPSTSPQAHPFQEEDEHQGLRSDQQLNRPTISAGEAQAFTFEMTNLMRSITDAETEGCNDEEIKEHQAQLAEALQEISDEDFKEAIEKWEVSDTIDACLKPIIAHLFSDSTFKEVAQKYPLIFSELQQGNYPSIITQTDFPMLSAEELNEELNKADGFTADLSLKQRVIEGLRTLRNETAARGLKSTFAY